MKLSPKIIVAGSVALSLVVLGGALLLKSDTSGYKPAATHPVTKSQLAYANGKDGRECLVAVEGTVYLIKDVAVWQNGEHTTSNGEARCGLDLSEAIKHAPHGEAVLQQLPTVGPLVN